MEKQKTDIFATIAAIIGSMMTGSIAIVLIFSRDNASVLPMIAFAYMLLGTMLGYFASKTLKV